MTQGPSAAAGEKVEAPTASAPVEQAQGASAAAAPDRGSRSERSSGSLLRFLDDHQDGAELASGQVVLELLRSHPSYLDERVAPGDIGDWGSRRTASAHLDEAARLWDADISPVLTTRRVILALAMDPEVGWALLQSGVVASLLGLWRPRARTGRERDHVVWDLLSDAGRALAVEQPLLAAALGGPAEWSLALPAEASAVAWDPTGDRLALVADGVVYVARRGGSPQRIGMLEQQVLSLGWSGQGVQALCLEEGSARLVRIGDGKRLGEWPAVNAGTLSGDGSVAWLLSSDSLLRWVSGGTSPTRLGPAARPLAVDWTGRLAVVEWQGSSLLLVTDTTAPLPRASNESWPSDGAPVIGSGAPREQPCALLTLGRLQAIAAAVAGGGVAVEHLPFPPVANIATGPGTVTALAADPSGSRLAVAVGREVRVWPLQRALQSAETVPAYDSDRVGAVDLLDADRDARALAALIASRELKPPLAIGLFGAWGAGKSFVLDAIRTALGELTKPGHAEGYLDHVKVVRFNAWQYAEVNLWASLVDEVLREIGPLPRTQPPEQVTTARKAATAAEADVETAAAKIAGAEKALRSARRRRTWGRFAFWALAATVGIVGAAAVAVLLLGASAKLVAGYGAALALLTWTSGAVAQLRRVASQGSGLKQAGEEAVAAGRRLAGALNAAEVRTATTELLDRRHEYELAQERAARLRAEADRVQELSESPRLGAVLQRMSALTEYRDQLSVVTRTRDRFEAIDAAVTQARRRRPEQGDQARPAEDPGFQRVLIMLDDLDRCPPEKVVGVLEAVHLLFDFEMFVVVIAVDTRWLDQSLRIRYRQLLGQAGGAAPSDYLEKIIQLPLHLPPLDENLVRGMMAGLTGAILEGERPTPDTAGQPDQDAQRDGQPDQGAATGAGRLEATEPRPPRPALPAEVMRITQQEANAMSLVAPLVGTTPRTVKRFVNTYRLLKARALDPSEFDEPEDGIGDHEVVAFLLALVTGHPGLANLLLPALARPGPGASVQATLNGLAPGVVAASQVGTSVRSVGDWLTAHGFAGVPARRLAVWASEVARFSFAPATSVPPPPGP